MKLRAKQIKFLMSSPYFASSKNLEESVYQSYNSQEELDYYRENAFKGFMEFEKPMAQHLIQPKQMHGNITPLRILVIGCGSGREAFGLEQLGSHFQIYAMDLVPEMINIAQTCAKKVDSQVKFFATSFPNLNDLEEERVDRILISSFVTNFLQGSDQRVNYLAKLAHLLKPAGEIYIYPSIQKLHFGSLEYFSSKLLKVNSWFKGWRYEQGDHVISTYHGKGKLMYFYHYPSEQDFLHEVQLAGYQAEKINEEFFRLSIKSPLSGF